MTVLKDELSAIFENDEKGLLIARKLIDIINSAATAAAVDATAIALKQNSAYAPAVGADYSPAVTTVVAALNQLAARVKVLETP